jgi:hypothetical protein
VKKWVRGLSTKLKESNIFFMRLVREKLSKFYIPYYLLPDLLIQINLQKGVSNIDHVNYLKDALKHNFINFWMKIIGYGSRRIWHPGPSIS